MKTAQRADVRRRHEGLSQELIAHEQGRSRGQEELTQREQRVDEIARALREAETVRDGLLPRLLDLEQRLAGIAQQIQSREQTRESLSLKRAHALQRLRELYQVDDAAWQAATESAPDAEAPLAPEQRATLTEQIRALRAKLEGFGPVSVGTIEEHEELTRRLDFLKSQQQDLLQSKDDLTRAMAQINRTARQEFQETFARITQEFRHYFTRLFNGGEANLVLLDPDHVLESGIDIIARPPGKRLQSISLLSGGERALTAIALLFALFKVRPSPLCILDEIDAPLDEANVDRFTTVLEEFLQLSQFILVTHNKTTIAKADSLYGVTMQEPGLSQIISAKLTQPEPELEPALSSVA
jgi:chromosome segregation protein